MRSSPTLIMKLLQFGLIISSIFFIKCQVVEELKLIGNEKPQIGDNVTVTCLGVGEKLYWKHRKKTINNENEKWNIISKDENEKIKSELSINNVTLEESGKYKCVISSQEGTDDRSIAIHVQAGPVLLNVTNSTISAGSTVVLTCSAMAAPTPKIIWFKEDTKLNELPRFSVNNSDHSTLHVTSLEIQNTTVNDSGSYKCTMENRYGTVVGMPYLIVNDAPKIGWKVARSLGLSLLQLEWALKLNPLPVLETKIYIFGESMEKSVLLEKPSNTNKILNMSQIWNSPVDELLQVYLQVSNSIGTSESVIKNVTMLTKEPFYSPEGALKGSTKDSLSASWTSPPEDLVQYVDIFRLYLRNTVNNETIEIIVNFSQHYLFVGLEGGTKYEFSVMACLGIFATKDQDCGKSSSPVSGRTLFNPPEGVADVIVRCISNRSTGRNSVLVTWLPPTIKDHVDNYKIEVLSSAQYINEKGSRKRFIGPIQKYNFGEEQRNVTIGDLQPNTNYTIRVYAGIGNVFSSALSANCETPIWLPRKHNLHWWKFRSGPRTVLKMQTPYVSERNGTICCHRIVVVKLMENKTLIDLPPPQNMPILSFDDVHALPVVGGYVAEAFSGRSVSSGYLLLGDARTTVESSPECAQCLGIDPITSASTDDKPDKEAEQVAQSLAHPAHQKALPYTKFLRREVQQRHIAQDKHLIKESNYTGFLILTVRDRNGSVMSRFSNYFNVIQPKADPLHLTSSPSSSSVSFSNIIYLLATLLVILILMAVALSLLLVYYHRRRKMLIDDGTEESLTGSLGRIFRTLRRSHTLMSQPGIEVNPIQKEELVPQYLEKLKDSELGFRKEFEALPEKFYDRSSKGSEMADNSCKNRYPDIKAYDQTRVKLSQLKGIQASDYINANYVMGYKERKKFICAQGPMESTVNDFWRMIVEQRSSLCIMLTNLEETGKVKCVKYWPEAGEPKTFGNITVRLVKEKPYADYLVRTLRAEWQVTSSTPTSEATDTENGAVKNDNGTNSNYNSLSSSNTTTEETKFHEVQQYHYLMWKDFIAPEHPVGLLSFLRRINEAYSPDMGPLLVHCSAGVGRTGTLVALNTLVAELDEEGQASIFNNICDLRHQRNFLVQSLKQYVFIHRALMEHAQFGNTEQRIPMLKNNWKKHNQLESDEISDLQKEFERLGKIIEERKAFTVAHNDANKSKNRYDFVLPYDTNCVILHPLPAQIGSIYINASFTPGFDLGENFIVTQDPLENTIADFWRMIYEQGVTTIVMLSELGSGEDCCNKYWPDEEDTFEYVAVKFVSSESYPKYSTRSFLITNNKTNDTLNVAHFQYVGWSGLMGEVPLVTLGIMEVISRVQSQVDSNMSAISHTVVHCSGGGDRSSVYVCLNNCLRHLKRESCVDVFQTARKIRSQRQYQIQSFAQYEFIYKALVEYIELKGETNL